MIKWAPVDGGAKATSAALSTQPLSEIRGTPSSVPSSGIVCLSGLRSDVLSIFLLSLSADIAVPYASSSFSFYCLSVDSRRLI